ncbi:anonymous antigen-7 like protein [Theileria equi strain WA]|uniref:Anonymous antigen-7 like protein n=1 Tax=Theileria equi strain WA TaxID=1537102 RepID=L0AXU3_THEEQ|nr:anonymous antigen-7 like protein [Theileria equi strain WA]AFZ79841.1 anonymous antigen-7 like protein [Theileria equi strain WA]|eukprot:XP_004829507.1 anonymous antigen-7 like protein [Theileria equi strain WA]
MLRCDNCGELITSFDTDSEVTCGVCGVVQSITQTIVEEYSHAYSQTQRAGRLVGPTQEVPKEKQDTQTAQEDFDLLVGIQMVMDYLCKALIKNFAFSNQVEIEAKELWTRYLNYIVDNNIPISTMFNHPLPKDHTYFVPPSYIQNTNQIPEDYTDSPEVHPRLRCVINDMGSTSFEYSSLMSALFGETHVSKPKKQVIMHTKSVNVKSILTKKKEKVKSTKHKYYDFSHVEEHMTEKNREIILERAKNSRIPRSRKCSPLGFSLLNIEKFLKQRGLPMKPKHLRTLELTNPLRLCHMMESLYRHDFLWKLLYDYPDVRPLEELEGYTHVSHSSIEDNPLDINTLLSIADSLGIHTGSIRVINTSVRMDIINLIFIHIIEKHLGYTESRFSSTNVALLLPMIDLQLVCTIIFLALIKCRYGIVANDITRWIIQGRIPLKGCVQLLPAWILRASHRRGQFIPNSDYVRSKEEEATQNLFTQTNAPRSTQHLEIITARFITAGVIDGSEIEFNVHGLCRRIVHHARLPVQVLAVVDLILAASIERHSYSENQTETTIYGTCFREYPTHVFGAAVVLAACRMLWPIFHYQPPAFPNFAEKGEEIAPKNKVKLQERFSEPIEFNVHKMSWIVKVADAASLDLLDKLEDVHVGKKMQVEDSVLSIFDQLLEMTGMEPKNNTRVYDTRERIKRFKWLCGLMGGNKNMTNKLCAPDSIEMVDGFKLLYFSASRHGFETSGVNAIMWLLYTNPVAATTALSNYYIKNDLNRLRRFVIREFRKRSSYRFINGVLYRYVKKKPNRSFLIALTKWIKREQFPIDYWLNFLGTWSGSVLKCIHGEYGNTAISPPEDENLVSSIKVQEMKEHRIKSIDSLISALKGSDNDMIYRIKETLPSNKEIFYKIRQLFNTYPFYSGWSLEKSLEYDNYRNLIKNQRMQVLRSMREILDTDLCQTQNDYWTDFTLDFTKKLYIHKNAHVSETPTQGEALQIDGDMEEVDSGTERNDPYKGILEEMEGSFQEMETITTYGRTLPRNPWQYTGKRHGGTPIAYLMTLKVVSNFIGSPHTIVHHCLCDLEEFLINR